MSTQSSSNNAIAAQWSSGSGVQNAVNAWCVDSANAASAPIVAQRVVVGNQVAFLGVSNSIVESMQEAQKKELEQQTESGYRSAAMNYVQGGTESAIGAGGGVSSTKQIGAAQTAVGDIKGLYMDDTADPEVVGATQDLENANKRLASAKQNRPLAYSPKAAQAEVDKWEEASKKAKSDLADAKLKNAANPTPKNRLIHETERTKIEMAHKQAVAGAERFQNGAQALFQPINQTGQGQSQVAQMKSQVAQSLYGMENAAGQSALQAMQTVLQVDVYSQNVASSRA